MWSARPDVQAHQIGVFPPEAEPSAHLHQSVSLAGASTVVRNGKTLDREPSAELRAADEDSPDRSHLKVEVLLSDVLVSVDDQTGSPAFS